MIITHASHHSWYKDIKEDVLQHYSKSDRKKLEKTIRATITANVVAEFKKADEDFFAWFIPLYNETISKKSSPNLYDVRGTTVDKTDGIYYYKTLTLKQNGIIIGGCIFSCWKGRYSIAYRIYLRDWPSTILPASPSLYGEYLMDDYTKSHNKQILTHGLDRNLYGIHSAIGLAMFKLSAGCQAKLRIKHLEKYQIDTDKVQTDVLVLHYPDSGEEITEATLVCLEDNQSKYVQLKNYSERLKINTIFRY